jgi:hypothetical protein
VGSILLLIVSLVAICVIFYGASKIAPMLGPPPALGAIVWLVATGLSVYLILNWAGAGGPQPFGRGLR